MSPLLLIVGLITGTMIGTFGVGGVLLAPLLSYGLGVDLHIATAISSWSFLIYGHCGHICLLAQGQHPVGCCVVVDNWHYSRRGFGCAC